VPSSWRQRPAGADETPKRGGTLTYMIPADAPPSFDGHRERPTRRSTPFAPFYSVLIRHQPGEPVLDHRHFVCDLCTEMPKPTDDGKTYTFKIREGVKFHDGTPLTAATSRRAGTRSSSRRRRLSAREQFTDGRQGRGADRRPWSFT
jgi:ABC-type transport system substrate-binding protein